MNSTLRASAFAAVTLTTPADEQTFYKPVGPTKAALLHAEYTLQTAINPTVVFYEAMSGSRLGDSPLAIFEYLRSHPEYGEFLHVWSVDAVAAVPQEYRDADDIVIAPRHSSAYAYFLATAGYVVGNANLPEYFVRRPGQRYLNTWHGIAYKAIGRDSPKSRFGVPAGTATYLKATHVLSPCAFMTDAMLSGYSMTGTSTALIAETGYPRIDQTVAPAPGRADQLREQLGIETPADGSPRRPVVLYAPTWRAENGSDVVDTEQLMQDLGALAALDSITLVYRGHHRMDRIIRDKMVGNEIGRIVVPDQSINSNDLMTAVDIVISDYSSIFFDFLGTGRPVIHYLYDLDEYRRTRGLNLGLEELPGSVALNIDELIAAVEEAASAVVGAEPGRDLARHPLQGEAYERAQKWFCPYDDGHASQRAVDFFFKDTVDVPVTRPRDGRPTIAFWAGSTTDNEQLDAFLQTVVLSGKWPQEQATLVIDKAAVISKPTVKKLKALKVNLSTVSYVATTKPTLLPSEVGAHQLFVSQQFETPQQLSEHVRRDPVLQRIFDRAYRRRLDDATFDTVVLAPWLSPDETATAMALDPAAAVAWDAESMKAARTLTVEPMAPKDKPSAAIRIRRRIIRLAGRIARRVGLHRGQ